jgi:hypothetical protein
VRDGKSLTCQKGEADRKSNLFCVEHVSGGTHPGADPGSVHAGCVVARMGEFMNDSTARGHAQKQEHPDDQ